jgi:UDP-N-acetylglucosamine 2-epimerase (non-hydrolysing)
VKILCVFGTRPEVIKLAPVIQEARHHHGQVEMIVCSTGQHREMLDQALRVFGIEPDVELSVMRPNQSLAGLTARLLEGLAETIKQLRPDAVMVQGDTTSAFAAALAAFYAGVPVAHVEAGLRTGHLDSPFPEELNRVMIGRMARWHFPPTRVAADNLDREGVPGAQVLITGNTVVDAIDLVRERWSEGYLPKGLPALDEHRGLVLLTVHRRENFGGGIERIADAIRMLAERFPGHDFVFPVHLNPRVREPMLVILGGIPNLYLVEPVDFDANLYLQSRADVVITDSGGIQEEAPSFGVPAVVVRRHTERMEGVDAGFAVLVGTETDAIVKTAERYLSDREIRNSLLRQPNPYGDGKAAQRILASMQGYAVEEFSG